MITMIKDKVISFSHLIAKVTIVDKYERKKLPLTVMDKELEDAVREYNICLKNERMADTEFIGAAIYATKACSEKINAIIRSKKKERSKYK